MSSAEIGVNPPIQPNFSGIAEKGLAIIPPVVAVAILFGIAYFGLRKSTSSPKRRS